LAGALQVGREYGKDGVLVVSLSGRGDKDMDIAASWFGYAAAAGASGPAVSAGQR